MLIGYKLQVALTFTDEKAGRKSLTTAPFISVAAASTVTVSMLQIRKLRWELEAAKEKVSTLTCQLSTNVSIAPNLRNGNGNKVLYSGASILTIHSECFTFVCMALLQLAKRVASSAQVQPLDCTAYYVIILLIVCVVSARRHRFSCG